MGAKEPHVFAPGWQKLTRFVAEIGSSVTADGIPEVLVGVLRGGMIPAVQLAHLLGVRTVRALEVTHTQADCVNSPKTPRAAVANEGSLGYVFGQDVLIIDDIAGSGLTMKACRDLVWGAQPARVRTAALTVNAVNWHLSNDDAPRQELDYVGHIYGGWVIFPWERQ
jgi:hypoxanthine phosphoribosyltransferase